MRGTPTRQQDYWRQSVAALHAATPPAIVPASGQVQSFVGPQGAGERWDVSEVHVSTSSQQGMPPLVIQQQQAQATGQTVTPPPPVVAQVWQAAAGQPVHLLASTNTGGYDNLGISGPVIAAGEQILVIWFGADPDDTANATIKGTKYVLDT